MGYSSDEEKLIKAFRKLSKGRQNLIVNSFNAFKEWLKEELHDLFIRIGNRIRDFFYSLASIFG